jgi:glucokinase
MPLPYHSRRMPTPARGKHVIAVDLGGTKIAVALADARGRLRCRLAEPVDTSSATSVLDQIVRMARAADDSGAMAIGVAVPGLVRRDGTVWAPNLPGWDAFPLARRLRQRLRLPVHLESDRNAAVLGEVWRGAARGKSDVIVLIVGTGIGAGILSAGGLVRGAHELSGCAGWLVVSDSTNEWTDRCGSLESLTAGPAVGRAFGSDTAAAADAARHGDKRAQEIFKTAGRLLGYGVANLISVLDPEVVVLTGGLSNAADLFLEELKRAVSERAQPLSAPRVGIVVSTLQADANLLGAARLAIGNSGSPTRARQSSSTATMKKAQS